MNLFDILLVIKNFKSSFFAGWKLCPLGLETEHENQSETLAFDWLFSSSVLKLINGKASFGDWSPDSDFMICDSLSVLYC